MKLIEFEEQTTVIGGDQPEYQPMPAHASDDDSGVMTCCWQLSWRERVRVLWRGRLWHQVMTFNKPLQPQRLQVEKPEMDTCVTEMGWEGHKGRAQV